MITKLIVSILRILALSWQFGFLILEWVDNKLQWSSPVYGGIEKLHIPSVQLWTPDIVLYNNAAGDPEITISTDALVYSDGRIVWKPPAIYKSFCDIDVTWFPYDDQNCYMKFGLWTYTGDYVDMRQLPEENVTHMVDEDGRDVEYLELGMDLSYYYQSAEWDLMNVTSRRYEMIYESCCGPEKYVDIRYYFKLRRKTLFYTANLIIPCTLISFLTCYVFLLPAESGDKITFSISILVTLTVFFLVLIDLIPPTSTVIPLFGKYLTFTMVLVSCSVVISVITVNIHHRKASTCKMPRWVHTIFLKRLPRLLCMDPPQTKELNDSDLICGSPAVRMEILLSQQASPSHRGSQEKIRTPSVQSLDANLAATVERHQHIWIIRRVLRNIHFIAQHFREEAGEAAISTGWMYVAMVIDRIFLIMFSVCNIFGTMYIICQAPTLYDTTPHMVGPDPTRPLGGDTRIYD